MALGMMGDACTVSEDCGIDLVCIASMCDIAPPAGMLGDYCFVPDLPCGEGLMCEDFSCVMSTEMMGDAMVGEECMDDDDCAEGLECRFDTCSVPFLALGESCAASI